MPVIEAREGREAHFLFVKAEFSEFLVRLSRFIVCSSPIHIPARYGGETAMVGLPFFEVNDFGPLQQDFFDTLNEPG